MKIVKKIMACEIDTISATDLLVRIDSPIDIRNKLEWHQDSAYFPYSTKNLTNLVVWTPFSMTCSNVNGSLDLIAKSYKKGP